MSTRPISGSSAGAGGGSIREITDPEHPHVSAFGYHPQTIEERLQRLISEILPNNSTTRRTQILSSEEEIAIIKWCEHRNGFLRKNPNLEKSEDICPITRERIYDKAELKGKDERVFIFERSSLLIWLLQNPTNPVTREEIAADIIKAVFAEGNDPIPFSQEGYDVVKLAAEGKLDELKKYFPDRRHLVDQVHKVNANGDLFSPSHYAIAKNQWGRSYIFAKSRN